MPVGTTGLRLTGRDTVSAILFPQADRAVRVVAIDRADALPDRTRCSRPPSQRPSPASAYCAGAQDPVYRL